jgi:hypothetical protein
LLNSPIDFTNNRSYFKSIPKRDVLRKDGPTYDAFEDDIAGILSYLLPKAQSYKKNLGAYLGA